MVAFLCMLPLFMMAFNTVLGLSCHVLERASATFILVYVQVPVNLSQMMLNINPMKSFNKAPGENKDYRGENKFFCLPNVV